MSYAIETERLGRVFGSRPAVEELTLAIPRGAVFGFLGPNGAGKTTTVRLLTGLIAPTGGTAVVAGHRLGVNDEAIRRSVRSEEHTSELQSRQYLVCRLLLEK